MPQQGGLEAGKALVRQSRQQPAGAGCWKAL